MKLVLALVASLALVTPALACPNMDHDEAPKTADKKPAEKKQEQPKTDTKAPDTAKNKETKPDKSTEKKPGDKVTMK